MQLEDLGDPSMSPGCEVSEPPIDANVINIKELNTTLDEADKLYILEPKQPECDLTNTIARKTGSRVDMRTKTEVTGPKKETLLWIVPGGENSRGLWIPFLEDHKRNLSCASFESPPPDVDWVASGPFSGCYAAHFSAVPKSKGINVKTGRKVIFAHLVTTGSNKAPPLSKQIKEIAAELGIGSEFLEFFGDRFQINAKIPRKGRVIWKGYVFWFRGEEPNSWYRRIVYKKSSDLAGKDPDIDSADRPVMLTFDKEVKM